MNYLPLPLPLNASQFTDEETEVQGKKNDHLKVTQLERGQAGPGIWV